MEQSRVAAHRAAVPQELRDSARWVRWVPVTRGGKSSKVPLQPDGSPASSTDSATWSSYARVRAHSRKGFVLGDGIGCVDLDHCLVDGVPTAAAAEVVASFPETYAEVSPGGDGVHLWFRMAEAPGSKRVVNGVSVETYSVSRFITVTGRRFGRCQRLAEF